MTDLPPLPTAERLFAVESGSEEETVAAGERLGRLLKPGDVVALYGELGAGKTRFARGVCRALGTEGNVSSPTFTLVHEYAASGFAVIHFDFYRMASPSELSGIGFAEYLGRGDAVCIIEWADRVNPFLPGERYEVRMSAGVSPERRDIDVGRTLRVAR